MEYAGDGDVFAALLPIAGPILTRERQVRYRTRERAGIKAVGGRVARATRHAIPFGSNPRGHDRANHARDPEQYAEDGRTHPRPGNRHEADEQKAHCNHEIDRSRRHAKILVADHDDQGLRR